MPKDLQEIVVGGLSLLWPLQYLDLNRAAIHSSEAGMLSCYSVDQIHRAPAHKGLCVRIFGMSVPEKGEGDPEPDWMAGATVTPLWLQLSQLELSLTPHHAMHTGDQWHPYHIHLLLQSDGIYRCLLEYAPYSPWLHLMTKDQTIKEAIREFCCKVPLHALDKEPIPTTKVWQNATKAVQQLQLEYVTHFKIQARTQPYKFLPPQES